MKLNLLKREKKCDKVIKIMYTLLIVYSALYGIQPLGTYNGFLVMLVAAIASCSCLMLIDDYSIVNTLVGKEASLNIQSIYIACVVMIFIYAIYVFRDNASVSYLLRNIFLFFLIN